MSNNLLDVKRSENSPSSFKINIGSFVSISRADLSSLFLRRFFVSNLSDSSELHTAALSLKLST